MDTRYHQNGRYVDAVNVDAVETTADERADEAIQRAHSTAKSLRAYAARFPELAEHADNLDTVADRAMDYEDSRDEANAAVRAAENERDAAGAAAIREGKDPAVAEAEAESALRDARGRAEAAQRHRETSARYAGAEAGKCAALLKRLLKENAEDILRERLVALDNAREEAIAAAENARRAMAKVYPHIVYARAAADMAPENELSQLVRTEFHPDGVRRGSSKLTYASIGAELDGVRNRLAYADPNPFSGSPAALGVKLGEAVRIAKGDADK